MPVRPNMKNALLDNRIMALREAHQEAGIKRAELDLSGGIDSAVMAGLLVLALGPENVTLVHSRFATNPAQSDRARRLAKGLDCPLVEARLGATWNVLLDEMKKSLGDAGYNMAEIEARIEKDPTILGSIRSCLRAPIGRGFNRLTGGGLRHGTGNECEDRWLRFYQKGGDGEVDSNPIAMLSKGEVYQLAWMLMKRLPKAAEAFRDTILATPSPDLWGTGDAHTDEAELKTWLGVPFTYSRIDIETGEYSHVGLIERVSRFLDMPCPAPSSQGRIAEALFNKGLRTSDSPEKVMQAARELMPTCAEVLFADDLDTDDLIPLAALAFSSGYFDGFEAKEIEAALLAARRAEKITRHKMNPNIPTYGTREELVRKGILTNDLPTIG